MKRQKFDSDPAVWTGKRVFVWNHDTGSITEYLCQRSAERMASVYRNLGDDVTLIWTSLSGITHLPSGCSFFPFKEARINTLLRQRYLSMTRIQRKSA